MGLCDQCQTIPLLDLPPFQLSDYKINLVGKPHYLNLIRTDDSRNAPKPLGFHWHQDRGGLWQSAAGGCPLCRLVDKQARLLLADLEDDSGHHVKFMENRPSQDDVLGQVKEKLKSHSRLEEKTNSQDDNQDDMSASGTVDVSSVGDRPLPRPSFDLWLTNRGSPGAGLMVFSTSVQESGVVTENCLVPIAIIGFYSEPQDPLSQTLTGRVIETVKGSDAFDLATTWLKQCDSRHRLCSTHLGQLPTRLLDLGKATECDTEGIVTVFEPTEQDPLQYAALSYGDFGVTGHNLWKSREPSFANKESNIATAKGEQIDPESISRMFQDAITVTRRLGLRYLWIGSLCIPSDDEEKFWTQNSENLAIAYRNAHLVIAAPAASDPSEGLFKNGNSKDYENFSMEAQSLGGSVVSGSVAALSLPLHDEIFGICPEVKSEPLSRNDWASQVHITPRRILRFTTGQLLFECIGSELGMWEDGACSPLQAFFTC